VDVHSEENGTIPIMTEPIAIPSFEQTLAQHGLALTKSQTTTLQVNIGLTCDLACRHCHLESGPTRPESMCFETSEAVVACAERFRFETIDITGGAPELLPQLPYMIKRLSKLTSRLIVRSNLTALARPQSAGLPELYQQHRLIIAASLPAVNTAQTDAQRGKGVWQTSLDVLKMLNHLGYGVAESGLILDLVANPSGAFLPAGQEAIQKRFRQELSQKHHISFNNVFSFANAPLGRFLEWLTSSGNLTEYRQKLLNNFNPITIPSLMCRSILSVDWHGNLFDCDFNLASKLPHSGKLTHISELKTLPTPGTSVPTDYHCYSCTAGSGFT
jgi:radical SAM/Cys-rich protein